MDKRALSERVTWTVLSTGIGGCLTLSSHCPKARVTTHTSSRAIRRQPCSTRSINDERSVARATREVFHKSTTWWSIMPSKTTPGRSHWSSSVTQRPRSGCQGGMLVDLLHLDPSRIDAVADGDSVSLGDPNSGFIHAPWVHWPETIFPT